MKEFECTVTDAFVFLKKKRPSINPNDKFLYDLLLLEHALFGNTISDQPIQQEQDKEIQEQQQEEEPVHRYIPTLKELILKQQYKSLYEYCEQIMNEEQWDGK